MIAECNIGGEDARLAALHRYQILDTAPEEAFERITRLVKTILDIPMVTVSLVDEDRQWFKSRLGVDAAETARDISFCTHTVEHAEPLIVADALADPRFANSPLVVGEPHIRFYAGVPLRSPDGQNVGALCAMDTNVRHLTSRQIDLLWDISRLVVDELELRLLATTDSLTGVLRRGPFVDEAARDCAQARRYKKDLSCLLLDADRFKAINDTHGHAAGDIVLQRLVSICKAGIREADYVGRLGGEEFAIMLPETSNKAAFDLAERLRKTTAATKITASGHEISITISIGVASCSATVSTIEHLLQNADAAMYDAKSGGRNRTVSFDDVENDPVDARMPGRKLA